MGLSRSGCANWGGVVFDFTAHWSERSGRLVLVIPVYLIKGDLLCRVKIKEYQTVHWKIEM